MKKNILIFWRLAPIFGTFSTALSIEFHVSPEKNKNSQLTFHLLHRGQLALPQIVERLLRRRFKLGRVLAHARRRRVAALAHAGMVPKAALVHVRVGQRVNHRDSLVLKNDRKKELKKDNIPRNLPPTHRIKDEHLAEQVNRLVGGVRAERVQGGQRRRLRGAAQHVGSGALAGVSHVLQSGRAEQFRDQFQLLKKKERI